MFKQKNFWRKYFYAKNKKNIISKFYKFELRVVMRSWNSSIPLNCNLNDSIVLPHGLNGIMISQGATIGRNVTIFQQVTIGSNNLDDSKGKGAPTIGDNCYIGAGAKIIGNVRIGNNVRIGANCVVVKDVPDNATVVCAENRVFMHKEKRKNNFKPFIK